MKILINLGTLKRGGGHNVGMNFLLGLKKLNFNYEFYFIVAKNSKIEQTVRKENYNYIIVSNNPFIRIAQEFFLRKKINKIGVDVIYTLFGYGNFGTHIPQIAGVADSNLFYPEIDFW